MGFLYTKRRKEMRRKVFSNKLQVVHYCTLVRVVLVQRGVIAAQYGPIFRHDCPFPVHVKYIETKQLDITLLKGSETGWSILAYCKRVMYALALPRGRPRT